MAALENLQRALVADKGYRPLDADLQAKTGLQAPAGLDWVGLGDTWGSVASVALVRADALSVQDIAARAEAYWGLVNAQRAFAGKLVMGRGIGKPAEVGLGSFGVLAFVFENGPGPGLVEAVQGAKRGSMRDKTQLVAWSVDAPLRKVHGHKGLPLAVQPPRKWMEGVLQPM